MANPAVIAAIISGLSSAAGGVSRGGPRRQFKWNQRSAMFQNRINRENQQWLMEQERELQREQREYDSPEAQMKRYLAAGLNPHLIYGSGSSAGQAFPIHAGSMPGVSMPPVDASYPDVAGSAMQGYLSNMQMQAQVGLAEARTTESYMKQALVQVQTDIARTNPMLAPGLATQVAETMLATARLKEQEMHHMKSGWFMDKTPEGMERARRIYVAKIETEIETMAQRLGLNTADLQIKNAILESKGFENALKEIQSKWLKDGEVTPEHIRQGVMLMMSHFMGSFK